MKQRRRYKFPPTVDALQIVAFDSAQEDLFTSLNQAQKLSLSISQYRYIQYHYRIKEKKQPSIGELLLLDRLIPAIPVADTVAPGEIVCSSHSLMETWADVSHVNKLLSGDTYPCTLSRILSLPKELLLRRGLISDQHGLLPRLTGVNDVQRATKGDIPALEISPESSGIPAWLWRTSPQQATPRPKDILLVIPNADISSVLGAFEQSSLCDAVLDFRLVNDSSLVQTALSLCGDSGLYVTMDSFLRAVTSQDESRMRIYLNACETPLPQGKCHALLRISALTETAVVSELKALQLQAYRYGYLFKNRRVIFEDNKVISVNLHADFIAAPANPTLCKYTLPDPAPSDASACHVSLSHIKEAGIALADGQVTLTGADSDGYSPAIQSVLSAVNTLAGVGIPYGHAHLSVIMTYQGEKNAPLLLSAACGLYRIATELGLPIEDADIRMTPPSAEHTLELAVYAYAPVPPDFVLSDEGGYPSLSLTSIQSGEDFALIREQLLQLSKAPRATECAQRYPVGTHRIAPLQFPTAPQQNTPEITARKESIPMKNITDFESLSVHPRQVLLDTDIGPDCDDVGALAVLIHYAQKYHFPISGICNCTSNKAGNALIDIVSRRLGIPTPPMGQWPYPDFMTQPEYCKYSGAVAEKFSEAYRNGTLPIEDAVPFYRRLLAAAPDGEVMMISIGMFNNLAALLESPADDISPLTGMELVKAKVYAMVSMAAILPEGRECNVICDYNAAKTVFDKWPTPIYFSDFKIGFGMKTGYKHVTDPETIQADPLVLSYHMYTRDWPVVGDNDSYDLTAVQFAVFGECEYYGLDLPGRLEFYAALPEKPDVPDATRFIPDPDGNRIFMTLKVPQQEVAESLNAILHNI